MTAAVRNQQLMVFHAVVYNSYGARLFTAETAMHQSSSSGSRSHERPLRHSAMATTGRCVPVAAR